MNDAKGQVVAAFEGHATVAVDAASACARCAAGRGCGAAMLQQGRRRLIDVKVAPGLMLVAGDMVRLELAAADLLRAAWLAYGLPLVAMLFALLVAAGAGPGSVFGGGDLIAVVFASAGLAVGVAAGREILKRDACLRRLTPTACEKLAACSSGREPWQAADGNVWRRRAGR